jgi:hypothetical protein
MGGATMAGGTIVRVMFWLDASAAMIKLPA